ncbi:MAG TPA: hypothetical protein VMV33_01495, partial [Rhodocyclaceae bacterium]|nr:hypothetical protein [Rhodocyclaceae bacterium]
LDFLEKRSSALSPDLTRMQSRNVLIVKIGSKARVRGGPESGPQCGAKLTFDPERRQCGGFRPFVGFGLSAYFVPEH